MKSPKGLFICKDFPDYCAFHTTELLFPEHFALPFGDLDALYF